MYHQRNILWICGVSTFLSIIISCFVIWNSYSHNKKLTLKSLEASARFLEKSITYTLETVHTVLKQIYADALHVSASSLNDTDASLQNTIIRRLKMSPYLERITVLDEGNVVLADSAFPENIGQTLASSDYRQRSCLPISRKNGLRIGHTLSAPSFQDLKKLSQQNTYKSSPDIIPVSLVEKSNTFPKRQIISAIKASWIFEFLKTVHGNYIKDVSILCASGSNPATSTILSTVHPSPTSVFLRKNFSEKRQKWISIHKRLEKYPIAIGLATTEVAIGLSWLRDNHSLLLVACLIPFGLGTFFVFLFLDSKRQSFLKKRGALESHALEQASFACMITDKNGYIVYVNKRFSIFFGYFLNEIEGKTPRFLKSNLLNDEKYEQLWETLVAGHEWEGDLINRTKDGELKWVKTKIAPLYNQVGLVTHYVCFYSGETFHKKEHNEATQALTRLDRNQQMSEHFLSLLCYDLAASLQSTANALLLFKSHCPTELPQTVGPYLTDILDGIHRAQSLTDDLATYYQVPHKAKETEPVDLNLILQSIKLKLRKEQPKWAFCLTYSSLPTVFARKSEVSKVFGHLIQNAIRVYYPLFSCKISVAAYQENTFWYFRITSTVNGTMQCLQREAALFHKASFATANDLHSETTELSVCKKIIKTYGGTIWIEREIGELEYRIFFTFPHCIGQKSMKN